MSALTLLCISLFSTTNERELLLARKQTVEDLYIYMQSDEQLICININIYKFPNREFKKSK